MTTNERENYPTTRKLIDTLNQGQKEFLASRCNLNMRTGIDEDYANVFNWIPDLMTNHKDDPDTLRYMFLIYMQSLEFLPYEARVQKKIGVIREEYNAVLGTNFPALETFIPPETKIALQQLLCEMKNILGVESVKARADMIDRYTHEELLGLLHRLMPIYEKAKQLIYGT